MPAVIFDLDGTLADTSRDLIEAANATLDELGLGRPLDPVIDTLTAFHGGRALMHAGTERKTGAQPDQGLIEQFYPRFLEIYEQEIDRYTRLYDGVEPALGALRSEGWKLGICTNKPVRLAEILIGRLGLQTRFDSLIGAGSLPVRKPDPQPLLHAVRLAQASPEGSVFVGDTRVDLETARAAGMPVLLVGFGPEGQAVKRLEPDAVLDHFRDLPDLARKLSAARPAGLAAGSRETAMAARRG